MLGGGVLNLGANVTLDDVEFVKNQVAGPFGYGGAVASPSGGTVTMDDCEFRDNQVVVDFGGGGGAVYDDGGVTLKVTDSTFDGNEVTGIRLPDITVPVATNTGWNTRHPETGSPELIISMMGQTRFFPKTAAQLIARLR